MISERCLAVRDLDEHELCLARLFVRLEEERLHPDDVHVVLHVVGEQVVVQLQRRHTLKEIKKYSIGFGTGIELQKKEYKIARNTNKKISTAKN
jgi:hypothetical protein